MGLTIMFQSNVVPKASLLLILLCFMYLALLVALGQDRAMDWGLSDDEMYLHEKLLSLAVATGVISTWILSMYRAHIAGSWRWLVLCLMFFPASYLYTFIPWPSIRVRSADYRVWRLMSSPGRTR